MPGPFIPDPTPTWLKPENASVTDTALTKAMRMIGHLIGADNPTAQVLGLMMSDVPSSGEVGGLAKAVEGLKQRALRVYHGSPTAYPTLQPGSMMPTDPAWAAGYTTKQVGGIGPEQFVGKVHAADVPLSDRTLTASSLHDAEAKLLDLAKQATGQPAKTLREAADVVREKFGYEAILSKRADGTITGVIPLTETSVSEHLDPLRVVREAIAKGQPVADNLRKLAAESAVKAYHGSPHDFERFSLEKIGTGEGAQAYGHGLYFAENPETAKAYRENLTRDVGRWVDPTGVGSSEDTVRRKVADAAYVAGSSKPVAESIAGDLVQRSLRGDDLSTYASTDAERAAVKAIGSYKILRPKGATYEVAIHADPEDFLDWDKPLSQQSEKVKARLGSLGFEPKPTHKWEAHQITQADIDEKRFPSSYAPGSWTSVVRDPMGKVEWHGGQLWGSRQAAEDNAALRSGIDQRALRDKGSEIYHDVGTQTKAEAASKLREAGIPGIKYLDQGSRAAGEGSRNYVVFDDRLIDILKKYGLLLPAAGAATQGQTLISPRGEQ